MLSAIGHQGQAFTTKCSAISDQPLSGNVSENKSSIYCGILDMTYIGMVPTGEYCKAYIVYIGKT